MDTVKRRTIEKENDTEKQTGVIDKEREEERRIDWEEVLNVCGSLGETEVTVVMSPAQC